MRRERPILDADVHNQYRDGSALAAYMPEGVLARSFSVSGAIPSPLGAFRKDADPPAGGPPGSEPDYVAEHHLNRYGIDYAILSPGSNLGFGGYPDVDFAAAVARATNDWTINEWLAVDERFLGSIVISARDPDQAADEIRRVGNNPRMVQVTITSTPCLLGDAFLDPIYAACSEVRLPFNYHVGGAEAGLNSGSYSVGNATSFPEYHVGMCVPALHHVVSMVMSGVFVKFADLRVVLNEFGMAWLPFVMWRSDMEYRAARGEVPWLQRLPSDYVRDHFRFTTQPLEVPPKPQDLVTLISLVGAEDMLMFSSDYPHWDFDSPELALKGFPQEWRDRIYFNNAWETFKLGERLGVGRAADRAESEAGR